MLPVLADALLVLGLLIVTLAVAGMIRLPDVYLQVHAAAKAPFLGLLSILASACLSGEGPIIARCVLIAGFLLLTTPVGAHAIARAAHVRERRLRQEPGAGG